MEGDGQFPGRYEPDRDFYPRPPRGGRPVGGHRDGGLLRFLSTPSARRATTDGDNPRHAHRISIHALREEGDFWHLLENRRRVISIHALREEGDAGARDVIEQKSISIHALREEGDLLRVKSSKSSSYFYPRPPRGGRRWDFISNSDLSMRFLSTPSARRATAAAVVRPRGRENFYPRPPRGGRRARPL